MLLVETHIIKKTNKIYKELDNLAFLSKNLYNSALYEIRQYYFNTKKYLNKYELINRFTKINQKDYISLPRKVSQQIIFQVDQNFKSFFSLIKNKKNLSYNKKIKIPKYLDKNKGRNILVYTSQAISSKLLRKNILKLSGLDFELKIFNTNIRQVRIIPRNGYYKIEILYLKETKQQKQKNNKIASIDLGLNNLATIGFNFKHSIILNGKPLKSINQFYNKKLSKYKSKAEKLNKIGAYKNKIRNISNKRNNRINDYLHKASRYIINHLVFNDVDTLIVGLNKSWKQEINIGRKNNQNFVQIPHSRFISLLKYKAELEGIDFIVREETYTSKCSFLDNESIEKHEKYLGKRIKRGLFRTSKGCLINADLNGALNILKKEVSNAFNGYEIEACSTPIVITL